MYRSRAVHLSLVVVIALAIQACDKPETVRHCVDENGTVVDEGMCATTQVAAAPQSDAGTGGVTHSTVMPIHMYRYWYGGYTPIGRPITTTGGSYQAPPNTNVASHSEVTRGGFGGGEHAGGGEGAGA